MSWKQRVTPIIPTRARVQWPTPLVPRYGRLRGGVCAQGAEVADEDYKHDDRTMALSRQVQAPTRDSFGHGTSLARPPEVDLTYPAWYLRSWLLYRPLALWKPSVPRTNPPIPSEPRGPRVTSAALEKRPKTPRLRDKESRPSPRVQSSLCR